MNILYNYRNLGDGEMAQRLRVQDVLPGELGSIPSSMDLTPSSGLHRHQAHTWYTVKYVDKTCIHIK